MSPDQSSFCDLVKDIRENHDIPACVDERLESLETAVSLGGDPKGWAGIDVFRALDPAGTAAILRDAPLSNQRLAGFERTRNFVALFPLLFTWLGLMVAAFGYEDAVHTNASLVSRPLLLLWEEGFNYAQWPFPVSLLHWFTLSLVAALDLLALIILILLTWVTHTQLNVQQAQREIQAGTLEQKLHQAAWLASLMLAERASPTAGIDQFRHASEQLLDELRANRQRIEDLEKQRESEVADLRTFAGALKTGAQDLLRASQEVKSTVNTMQTITQGLSDHVETLTTQQGEMKDALDGINTGLQAHNAATGALATQTGVLRQSADQIAVMTGRLERSVGEFRNELRDLQQYLSAERTAYQSSADSTKKSADELVKALQPLSDAAKQLERAATQIENLSKRFDNIQTNLGKAAADLAEEAKQLASTVRELKEWAKASRASRRGSQGTRSFFDRLRGR